MGTATTQATGRFLATGSLDALRRTGLDIETRPGWYATLFGQAPELVREVADFSRARRSRNRPVAKAALMARRPSPQPLDPVWFLRVVGRDVREHPDRWAHDIEATPDLARRSLAVSRYVAALPRAGGRAT